VRLHQASGIQFGLKEDRRADGNSLAGDRCGDIQMLDGEVREEALCWWCPSLAKGQEPHCPPIGTT